MGRASYVGGLFSCYSATTSERRFFLWRKEAIIMGNRLERIKQGFETAGHTMGSIGRKLGEGLERQFGLPPVHEQECAAEGRYEKVIFKTTGLTEGYMGIPVASQEDTYIMRCLDCRATGYPRFKTIKEEGVERRVEKIFKKRTL